MNTHTDLHYHNNIPRNTSHHHFYRIPLTPSQQNERKIIKAFLLGYLQQIFFEIFQNVIQTENTQTAMECYTMDNKIIQLVLHGIVESGEYTLEGIANTTRIPFDIILDAACGNSTQLSINAWAKIVDIYTQIKPEVTHLLLNKLSETKDKYRQAVTILLNEQ